MTRSATTKTGLSDLLRKVPDTTFWTSDTPRKPDYSQALLWVIQTRMGLSSPHTSVYLDQIGDALPNISSFQRAVAKEAARRRKLPAEVQGKPSIQETFEAIKKAAEKAYQKYSPLRRMMSEGDVAQGYMSYYLEKGFHEKYDPEKCPLAAWVGLGVRNWCVSRLRDKGFQFKRPTGRILEDGTQEEETCFRTVSGDQAGPGSVNSSILESFVGSRDEDPLSALVVEEVLAKVDGTPRGDIVNSPVMGACRFSKRAVIAHRIEGWTAVDIGTLFSVPRSTVSKIVKEVREELSPLRQ